MRGNDQQQASMWSYISPEQRVLQVHPVRQVRSMTDRILTQLVAQRKTANPSGVGQKVERKAQCGPDDCYFTTMAISLP